MSSEFSYDTIPYPSKFFMQTHPDRLATAATLYGMEPKAIENCRVLELGCGNGSNLISHAFGLPDASFVGVDLSKKHIETANAGAAELGLSNIEFRQMDVMDMTAGEFGEFDYITAHGLISWIPEAVRERVPALFNEMLTANGVGYISYNAYPGAYPREMVRSIMRFHTRETGEPVKKVEDAIAFLALLVENTSEKDVYGRILEFELKRHFDHSPEDIYHDDLGELYRPYYFHEFADILAKNDLQFLSEAELHASSTQGFSQDVIGLLDSMNDPILREQYLDFLRGRVFRQTLFCRKAIKLKRNPEPVVLDKLYLTSSLRPEGEISNISSNKVEKFASFKGPGMQIDHPLTKAALVYLGNIWGESIGTGELLKKAKMAVEQAGGKSDDWKTQFDITRSILLQICLGSDLIEMHIHRPAANVEIGTRPVVNKLACWQLRDANNVLTLLNKDLKINDDTARHLLEILDGSRAKADLVVEMKAFVSSSDEIEDKQDLIDNMPDWVDTSLAQLARLGVFE